MACPSTVYIAMPEAIYRKIREGTETSFGSPASQKCSIS